MLNSTLRAACSVVLCLLVIVSSVNNVHVKDIYTYTAVVKMEKLANVEKQMVDILDEYVNASRALEGALSSEVLQFCSDIKAQNEIALQPGYMENPINAFHFIQRIHVDWQNIREQINNSSHLEIVANFNSKMDFSLGISGINLQKAGADYLSVVLALVRLWQTYNLNLTELFSGQILDTKTDPLTMDELLFICNVLHGEEKFYQEVLWLDAIYDTLEHTDMYSDGKETIAEVVRRLVAVYARFGHRDLPVKILNYALRRDPHNKDLQREKVYYQAKQVTESSGDRNEELGPSREDLKKLHYETLCRGDGWRPRHILSKLKCFLRETPIPIYQGKEEVFNYNPRISMFHYVIYPSEIDFLKQGILKKLGTSRTVRDERDDTFYRDIRVSQTAWLEDDNDMSRRLSLRIQTITGLSTEMFETRSHAEYYQVLNYGVGGMYEPHEDYMDNLLENEDLDNYTCVEDKHLCHSGDRTATWMFYLSDVKAGGATVFTIANVTIPVVKAGSEPERLLSDDVLVNPFNRVPQLSGTTQEEMEKTTKERNMLDVLFYWDLNGWPTNGSVKQARRSVVDVGYIRALWTDRYGTLQQRALAHSVHYTGKSSIADYINTLREQEQY